MRIRIEDYEYDLVQGPVSTKSIPWKYPVYFWGFDLPKGKVATAKTMLTALAPFSTRDDAIELAKVEGVQLALSMYTSILLTHLGLDPTKWRHLGLDVGEGKLLVPEQPPESIHLLILSSTSMPPPAPKVLAA